jgi:hypothetical protein
MSSLISAIHLFLGLPLILVPIGFNYNIPLGVLLSSIRITWPSQAILLLFINLTMSRVFHQFVQFVIHSDSPGSIFILDWAKNFSQYFTLKYSEMLFVLIYQCPGFISVGHYWSYRTYISVTYTSIKLQYTFNIIMWGVVVQVQLLEWKALIVFHKFILTTCFDAYWVIFRSYNF